MQTFNQTDIVKAVALCKKADCKPYVTIPSLQKMLGCKRLDIVSYIDENPDLFHCEERFRDKYVTIYENIFGKKFRRKERVNGDSLGLCIIEAYSSPEKNPWAETGLKDLIKRNARTIWISEVNNYGQIEGHTVQEDKKPSDLKSGEQYKNNLKNTWLWRNTHEKVQELLDKGIIKRRKFWMGGIGDSYSVEGNEITSEGVKALEAEGWTVIGKWF